MKIRPMVETDVNFVLSTWLRSYYEELKRNGTKGVIYPKDDIFFQGHQAKIKMRLADAQESGGALVCTAPDDDNQIIGWIIFKGDCAHYCYVKQVFRKMGVAKALRAKALVKFYSHHTRFARYLNQGLIYDPYKF
jgi:hypothetical protein